MDLFHVGPQKAATTWVYQCLVEHNEVACLPTDTVHYYDMFYHKGPQWYADHFEEANGRVCFDSTTTYIRSPWAARRIASDNPDAKIMMCLRNPIDRAFSHYWHEKKKGKYNFDFSEVLENYDLFSSWVEPGFYAEHIERFLQHFPREQVRCLRFEKLKKDPEAFLRDVLVFADVNPDFTPSFLNRKVNAAGGRHTAVNRVWRPVRRRLGNYGQEHLIQTIQGLPVLGRFLNDKYEYEQGMSKEVRRELEAICAPEIERLETLLDIDLQTWH